MAGYGAATNGTIQIENIALLNSDTMIRPLKSDQDRSFLHGGAVVFLLQTVQ